jgi:hypothetical protein
MRITVLSIGSLLGAAERTETFGRYRVVLNAEGGEQILTYTIKLVSPRERSLSFQPSDSILADPRVDVLTVAAVNDLVVDFHLGVPVELPYDVPLRSAGPDTAVIRL